MSCVPASTVESLDKQWKHFNGVVNTDDKAEEIECVTELHKTSSKDEIQSIKVKPEEPLLLPGETSLKAETLEDKTEILFWSDCFFVVLVSIIVRLMYTLNMSSMFAEASI